MPFEISSFQVCSEPNIWVFDGLLSDTLLDHVDGLFESQALQTQDAKEEEGWWRDAWNSSGVLLDINETSRELVAVLEMIGHVRGVRTCRRVLISDISGDSQDAHVDHVNLDELGHMDNNLQFLDLEKQSRSKSSPKRIVPTFSFVVYFNHVGGIRFPHAKMQNDTIAGERGRIVMFQNYIDELRPEHNPLCAHYGIYLNSTPKRVMTAGILANATPKVGCEAGHLGGLLYCPGLGDEGVRHDNPGYYGGAHRMDTDEPPKKKPPNKDMVLTVSVTPDDQPWGPSFLATCTTMGGEEACVVRLLPGQTTVSLKEQVKAKVGAKDEVNLVLVQPDGRLLDAVQKVENMPVTGCTEAPEPGCTEAPEPTSQKCFSCGC